MSEKSEEQIAKDKEAVARMSGAKASMEAALRRIEQLEMTLNGVRRECESIDKAFNETVYLHVFTGQNYQTVKLKELFGQIDKRIKAVL